MALEHLLPKLRLRYRLSCTEKMAGKRGKFFCSLIQQKITRIILFFTFLCSGRLAANSAGSKRRRRSNRGTIKLNGTQNEDKDCHIIFVTLGNTAITLRKGRKYTKM